MKGVHLSEKTARAAASCEGWSQDSVLGHGHVLPASDMFGGNPTAILFFFLLLLAKRQNFGRNHK